MRLRFSHLKVRDRRLLRRLIAVYLCFNRKIEICVKECVKTNGNNAQLAK